MANWTQPICDSCWHERNHGRPVRIRGDYRDKEKCCYCGEPTLSGIYVRADPAKVPHPKLDE